MVCLLGSALSGRLIRLHQSTSLHKFASVTMQLTDSRTAMGRRGQFQYLVLVSALLPGKRTQHWGLYHTSRGSSDELMALIARPGPSGEWEANRPVLTALYADKPTEDPTR